MTRTTLLLLLTLLAAPLAARPLKVTTVRARVDRTLAPLTSRLDLSRAAFRLEIDPLHGAAVVFTHRDPRGRVRLRVSAERRRGRVLDIYIAATARIARTGRDEEAGRARRQRRGARIVLRRLVPRRHRRFRLTHQAARPDGERALVYVARKPRRALAHYPDRVLIVVDGRGRLRSASLTHVDYALRRPPPVDRATALRLTGGDTATLVVRHRRPGEPHPVWRVRRGELLLWFDAVEGGLWCQRVRRKRTAGSRPR